ncbi:hypothetical protein LC724_26545 [Blautia sp. RD014234]|nr:hypothetical protein [Blautia parvula]
MKTEKNRGTAMIRRRMWMPMRVFDFLNSSLGSEPDFSAEANMRKGLELSAFFSGQSSHENSDGAAESIHGGRY